MIKLPILVQPNNYSCGLTCVRSILQYHDIFYEYTDLEDILNTNNVYGTNSSCIVKFLKTLFNIKEYNNVKFKKLTYQINKKDIIIIALQAYKKGNEKYGKCIDNGHYSVIIGRNKNTYTLFDPAENEYKSISKKELKLRWYDLDDNDTKIIKRYVIRIKSKINKLKPIE